MYKHGHTVTCGSAAHMLSMANPNERRDVIGRYAAHDRSEAEVVILTASEREQADDPTTPPGRLERLSYSKSIAVRDAVIRNPNTPESTLQRYLDLRIGMRSAILRNAGLSDEFLLRVAEARIPKDMQVIASRPDLSSELFHACARGGMVAATIVGGRKDAPAAVLDHLANNTGWRQVAQAVADNPAASREVRAVASRRAYELHQASLAS